MSTMNNERLIVLSRIGNTYGSLVLVESDGCFFLKMEDCCGPSFYGPLTDTQVDAFLLLATVPEYGPKE